MTPSEIRHLYDGEKTVVKKHFSGRDDSGAVAKRVGVAKENFDVNSRGREVGYRSAMIYDGAFPQPGGLSSFDNPLNFMNAAEDALREAVSGNATVALEGGEKESGPFVVRFRTKGDSGSPDMIKSITIDPRLGWVVTHWRVTTAGGDLLIDSACAYKEGAGGFGVPTGGFWKGWSEDRTDTSEPIYEKGFTVESMALNDPGFTDESFKVVLEPKTHVSDLRYKAVYTVGAEKAVDENLAALADAARAEAAKKLGSGDRTPTGPGEAASVVAILTLIAVGILILARLAGWKRK